MEEEQFDEEHIKGLVIAHLIHELPHKERLSLSLAVLFKIFCDDNDLNIDAMTKKGMKEKDAWIKTQTDEFSLWTDEMIRQIFGCELSAFDFWEMDYLNDEHSEITGKVITNAHDLENRDDIPDRIKNLIKKQVRQKKEHRLSRRELNALDENDLFLHICNFHDNPIQHGEPTQKDFNYLLKITVMYHDKHSSGIREESDPSSNPWLIEPDVYTEFDLLFRDTDIQFGYNIPAGFKEITSHWFPNTEFVDPLQDMWDIALKNTDDHLAIHSEEELFQWIINNHTGQYLGFTGAGPSTLRFTIYEKE